MFDVSIKRGQDVNSILLINVQSLNVNITDV